VRGRTFSRGGGAVGGREAFGAGTGSSRDGMGALWLGQGRDVLGERARAAPAGERPP
jgi:hypothetical protein